MRGRRWRRTGCGCCGRDWSRSALMSRREEVSVAAYAQTGRCSDAIDILSRWRSSGPGGREPLHQQIDRRGCRCCVAANKTAPPGTARFRGGLALSMLTRHTRTLARLLGHETKAGNDDSAYVWCRRSRARKSERSRRSCARRLVESGGVRGCRICAARRANDSHEMNVAISGRIASTKMMDSNTPRPTLGSPSSHPHGHGIVARETGAMPAMRRRKRAPREEGPEWLITGSLIRGNGRRVP